MYVVLHLFPPSSNNNNKKTPLKSCLVMLQSLSCSQTLKGIQAQIYLTALNYLAMEYDLELNLCVLQQHE